MAHKISVTVSDETKKRLDDYRFGNRIDRFQTAVLDVLEAGLISIENAERTNSGDVETSDNPKTAITQDDDHPNV